MTYEFGNEANLAKLFDYEWELEKLFDKRPELCGVCQYHQDTLPAESLREGLSVHRLIFVNETLSLINPHYMESRKHAEQAAANPGLDHAVQDICESDHRNFAPIRKSAR
jgi:MEDS: MEthanogen/methylotroph, DcmR Sensory domain